MGLNNLQAIHSLTIPLVFSCMIDRRAIMIYLNLWPQRVNFIIYLVTIDSTMERLEFKSTMHCLGILWVDNELTGNEL